MASELLKTLHTIRFLSMSDLDVIDPLELANARLFGAKIFKVRRAGLSVYHLDNWAEISKTVTAWIDHESARGDDFY